MSNFNYKESNLFSLDGRSVEIRERLLEAFKAEGRGHLGSNFSLVEILRIIFDEYLNAEKAKNRNRQINKLIVSQGWASLIYYYFLADKGIINFSELNTFLSFNSRLGGCLDSSTPGVHVSTGSCGHGLPVAAGMAFAWRLMGKKGKIFVTLGDGELGEGSVWEALLSIGRKNITNIIPIIDSNKFQCAGKFSDITGVQSLKVKFESFGFVVHEVNGHDIFSLSKIFNLIISHPSPLPSIVIAHTVIGKGFGSIEGTKSAHWVGKF